VRGGKPVRHLQFVSVPEFLASVESIVDSFSDPRDPAKPGFPLDTIADLYADFLQNIIAVDIFFGSCVLFVPAEIAIDLKSVCGYSGYVHSCGKCLFIRNIHKARKDLLFEKLSTHFQQNPDTYFRFIAYGHEDFPTDKHHASDLRDGLDDVMVFVEKYFIGAEPLVTVLRDIKDTFKNNVYVPEPLQRSKTSSEPQRPAKTLWLILDHRPAADIRQKGEDKFFLCYEQEYKNDNPLHLFDENKPAWTDHTTLPHTLAAAMINITKPWWPQQGLLTIGDPFVGTGTTLLEALKYEADGEYSDGSALVQTLVGDNLEFFSLDNDKLQELADNLGEAKARFWVSEPKRRGSVNDLQSQIDWARTRFKALFNDEGDLSHEFSEDDRLAFEQGTLLSRFLLYVAMRTERRHVAGFIRGDGFVEQ
jgi:hypothetical protein